MNDKAHIKRTPKRAIYDKTEIYAILDRHFLCHVGFIQADYPVVIPTMYGRKDDFIYLHGASVSRLLNELEKGINVCISIAEVSDLVLARSAFHHSLNYESVVIFGRGELVPEEGKHEAFKIIFDHLIEKRWEEVRHPNPTELKATKVIRVKIEEVSAKRRTGPAVDDKKDYEQNIWAGILPIQRSLGERIPDPQLASNIPVPQSVKMKYNSK